ncbi:flagellar biosynthetic protein FliO [Variovorax sp. AFSI2.2]|uniref:flagellar biosynthetic protein FliO n=1 Tax=Variovorax sp. AFSI2.2 TaxID=3384160 RepID=UPI003EBB1CB0
MNQAQPRLAVVNRAATCRWVLACFAIAAGLLCAVPASAQEAQSGAVASSGNTSLPSSIPVKRDPPGALESDVGDRWWIAILVAGGLLAYGVVAMRRKARSSGKRAGTWWPGLGGLLDTGSSHEIHRVSSTHLSPRHGLHVVVWNGKRLLLGCTDQSIQVLAESASSVTGDEAAPLAPGAVR